MYSIPTYVLYLTISLSRLLYINTRTNIYWTLCLFSLLYIFCETEKVSKFNRKVPVAVLVKVIFAVADNAIYFANMYINTVCTYVPFLVNESCFISAVRRNFLA